ncbi:hypothetical protein Vi05172_g1363 [Venturia inaequalis]|nr:hypothetical protein Vi05172_g1363 [Venturia inaequalis]
MPPTESPTLLLHIVTTTMTSTAHANPRTTFSNLPAELQQAIIIQSLDPGQWLMELSTNGPYRLFEMEKEINEQVARLFAAEAFLV